MRTVMTIVTLSAAGAGYLYLQQPPAAGAPYHDDSSVRPLNEVGHRPASLTETARNSVGDLVKQVHAHTKSILDDFVNQHGGHSDAPTDNAFQRLRQVTQSAATSSTQNFDRLGRSESGWLVGSSSDKTSVAQTASPRPIRLPPQTLDELHRIAFEPVAARPLANQPNIEVVSESIRETRESVETYDTVIVEPFAPVEREKTIPIVAEKIDSISAIERIESTPVLDAKPLTIAAKSDEQANDTVISNVSKASAAAKPLPSRKPPVSSPSGSSLSKSVSPDWKVVGKTVEGRPMHSMHFGTGGTRTLVIAGLDGEDRIAVRWLELLTEVFANQPGLVDQNEVVFFRAGNPDGLVHKVTENSHGVPLNRNFPSRRYRPTLGIPSTTVPASEIETRVMLDTLYTVRPRRVIHLVATSGRSQVLFNRSAKEAAKALERTGNFTLAPLDVEQAPGSIEDFSDGTLEAAVLSMRLNVGRDWQQAWKTLQPQIVSAVAGRSLDSIGREAILTDDPDRTPIPNANIEPVSRNPRRRGYEELPAPPQ